MFLIQENDLLYGRQGRMMNQHEESKTIVLEQAPDYFNELSEYLEVLSNSQRLKILKILERRPRDVRNIASEINTSLREHQETP